MMSPKVVTRMITELVERAKLMLPARSTIEPGYKIRYQIKKFNKKE